MRADRLIALLLLLQTHRRLTVAEIAARLTVSARTVLRDLDALSGLGVPVYTERGRGGGIRLLEGYATELNVLSPGEAEALALVSTPSVVSGLGLEKPLASALDKIAAAVPSVHQLRAQHARSRLLFDTSPWFHHTPAPPLLEQLRGAVWADRVCRIEYERGDGSVKRYRIEPYALVAKVDIWYLVADTASGMRTFRISRISSVAVVEEQFVRNRQFDLPRYWQAWCRRFEADTGHRYVVELWLTPTGKARLLERHGSWHATALEAVDDRAARSRITLDFEREHIAIGALFELAGEASVIRPLGLRRRLAETARAVLSAAG